MVDCCFLYSVESPCVSRPSLGLLLCTCASLYPLLLGPGVFWCCLDASLSVWTFAYLEIFHVVSTCNLSMFIFPFSESGVPLLFIYLFWHVPVFEAIAQMGCLPLECGRWCREWLCGWKWRLRKKYLAGKKSSRAHCLQLFLWVDALNNGLSETVAMHWRGNEFLLFVFLYLKLKANWKMKFGRRGETFPFIFAKNILI